MNKNIKMIYLILILTLNFFCAENKSTEWKNNKPELAINLKDDTIKFTSGVSLIFQDSKVNYCFGMADGSDHRYSLA
jgi:hypothetical protein